ncbi:MAG: hypothetical protein RMJ15_07355 [Nitrososphaerota archaeon]|nr:hypothetical protein [Candidatus Bathyarchaeota archaeon]MDW8023533.1 hypothetical protein [Nitrososphaerota archaeon]
MSNQPRELVVLLLRNVVFRHSEYRSLEDFLVEKYGFSKVEEKKQKISELKQLIPPECKGKIAFKEESGAPVVLEENERKISVLKIYEGTFLESKITVYIFGETAQKEDIISGVGTEEQYAIYTTEYQMVKLVSGSGYAIQQLFERLTMDLGIAVGSKEWIFHRTREG